MKFSREIEHAALATIRKAIIGTDIQHEDSHGGTKTTYRIAEVHEDRYGTAPCLLARCFPIGYEPEEEGDTGEVQLIIQAGFTES